MPNYVSIELSENKLLVVCAKPVGRRFQINQFFDVEVTDEDTDVQIGEKLKSALSENGVGKSEVIALVSREFTEIREVSVPPAPDNELPDLVRFQAKSVFGSMNDNWLLDFVPFAKNTEEKQQRVLAIAVAPQIKTRLETITDTAGMKLKRMVFCPYSLCDLYQSHLSGSKNRVLLCSSQNRIDIMVMSGRQLVLTRSVHIPQAQQASDTAAQVATELSRTVASGRKELDGKKIEQIIVGGKPPHFSELETAIARKSDATVVFVEPLSCLDGNKSVAQNEPECLAEYSALLGSLVREYSNGQHSVDFLHPRQRVVKQRDYKKFLVPLAAALIFIFVGTGFCWYVLNQQKKEIASLDKQLQEVKKQNEGTENRPGVEQIIGEVGELDNWYSSKANWLDELAWLSKNLLTPDDVIIAKFRGFENKTGFKIDLNSSMTEAKSEDSSWKEVLSTRYESPNFGQITSDPSNKEYPVKRPFSLTWKSDIEATIEKCSEFANSRRIRELDLEISDRAKANEASERTEE